MSRSISVEREEWKTRVIIPVVYIDRRCTRGARLVHFKISTDPRPRRTPNRHVDADLPTHTHNHYYT